MNLLSKYLDWQLFGLLFQKFGRIFFQSSGHPEFWTNKEKLNFKTFHKFLKCYVDKKIKKSSFEDDVRKYIKLLNLTSFYSLQNN